MHIKKLIRLLSTICITYSLTSIYVYSNVSSNLTESLQTYVDEVINSKWKLNLSSSDRKNTAQVDVLIILDQSNDLNDYYKNAIALNKFDLGVIDREYLQKWGKITQYGAPHKRRGGNRNLAGEGSDTTDEEGGESNRGEDKRSKEGEEWTYKSGNPLYVRYAIIPKKLATSEDMSFLEAFNGSPDTKSSETRKNLLEIFQATSEEDQGLLKTINEKYPYPDWVINLLKHQLLFTGKTWNVKKPTTGDIKNGTRFWDIKNLRILVLILDELMYTKIDTDSMEYYKIQQLEESYAKIASEQHIVSIIVHRSNRYVNYTEIDQEGNKETNTYPIEYSKIYSPFTDEASIFTGFTENEITNLENSEVPQSYTDDSRIKDYRKPSLNTELLFKKALKHAIEDNFFLLGMDAPIVDREFYKNVATPQSRLDYIKLPFEKAGKYGSDSMLPYQRTNPPNIFATGGYNIRKNLYDNENHDKLKNLLSLKYYFQSTGTNNVRSIPSVLEVLKKKIEHTSYLMAPQSSSYDCLGLVYANKFLSRAYGLANRHVETLITKMTLREAVKPFYVEPVFIIDLIQAAKCNVYMDEYFHINYLFSNENVKTCPFVSVAMKAIFDDMDKDTGLPLMKIKLELRDGACPIANDVHNYYPISSCVKPDPYMLPFGIRSSNSTLRVLNVYDLIVSEDNARNIDFSLKYYDNSADKDSYFIYSCEVEKCHNYYLDVSHYVGQNRTATFDKEKYLSGDCPTEGTVLPRNYADILVKAFKPASFEEMYISSTLYDGSLNSDHDNTYIKALISDTLLPIQKKTEKNYNMSRVFSIKNTMKTFGPSLPFYLDYIPEVTGTPVPLTGDYATQRRYLQT